MAARRPPSQPDSRADPAGLVCLGVVTGARGLRGEVRIKSFTAAPADIGAYGPLRDAAGGRAFRVKVVGEAKGVVVARIDGIGDRDAAEALKGTRLYLARQALPAPEEDEFYHVDLVGLRADLAGGGTLGTVRAVDDFGAGAVLEVAGGGPGSVIRGTVMVPFTRAVVPVVDIAGGRVVVDPPPGLLEPAAPEDELSAREGGTE
ncbi:MAG: ribosome maturation factor RimM [Hyphomicrobiales bacterium]|nr:ribosome maturation factor RimM [Hyphomicrobiales bacterium]MCP5371834.1 ribosome maturation factor RimM [Hyphomicrobiales bacterium]